MRFTPCAARRSAILGSAAVIFREENAHAPKRAGTLPAAALELIDKSHLLDREIGARADVCPELPKSSHPKKIVSTGLI